MTTNVLKLVTTEGSEVGFTAMVICAMLHTLMKSDTYQENPEFSKLIDQMVMETFNDTRPPGRGG